MHNPMVRFDELMYSKSYLRSQQSRERQQYHRITLLVLLNVYMIQTVRQKHHKNQNMQLAQFFVVALNVVPLLREFVKGGIRNNGIAAE